MLWGLARTSPSASTGTRCTCCFPAEVWTLALGEGALAQGVQVWRTGAGRFTQALGREVCWQGWTVMASTYK